MAIQNVQTSFLSGVLDPRAKGRLDTDAYAQGMLLGVNIEPIHLGGVRRRRGTRFRDRLPFRMTRHTSDITPTAPEGGTAANANDGSDSTFLTTTDPVGTTDPYVVVHYDLGSARAVHAADVLDISSAGGASTQFAIQYSTDNTNWTTLGSPMEAVDTFPRSYRRAPASSLTSVTARYWRVAKIGGTDMGSTTISLSGFHLWLMNTQVSNVRLLSFDVSATVRYIVAVTEYSGTVFDDSGALVARLPLPYAHADIPDLDAASSAETMVVVHGDYAPRFILRELSGIFTTEAIQFDSVPMYDFDDADSPTPVSDVQVITFASGWKQGDTFQIELEGARTAAIVYAGDSTAAERAATAANIAREVQKMWTVEGFTGVSCSRTGTREYTVTFAGASAAAYELMNVVPISSAAEATVAKSATGTPRTEPVWSATRGWPRTVAFFESRLYFGGTRSRQQTLFGSRVNSILDFQTSEGLPADPIAVTLDGANAIQGLFGGRSFEIFTTAGEYRYLKPQGEPITPSDIPKAQTFNGCARIRPVNVDGATIFVQSKRKSIRDYKYNYEEDAYDSMGVSALAPHLIYDVKDIAAYTGSRTDEINLVLVVNGQNADKDDDAFPDGTMAVLNTRKESNVQAWTIWTTDGEYRAVATSFEDIFVAVKRTIDGVDWLFFEQCDPNLYMDACIAPAVAGSTISGLDVYNGKQLRVRADGWVLGSVTPSGGSATLDHDSYVDVEVGIGFNPQIKPMPLAPPTQAGTTVGDKRRIVSADIMVRKSLGLRMNGQVLPNQKIDVMTFDAAQKPYSGVLHLESTSNWDRDADKEILLDQVDPLPLEILLIKAKVQA